MRGKSPKLGVGYIWVSVRALSLLAMSAATLGLFPYLQNVHNERFHIIELGKLENPFKTLRVVTST